MPLPRVPSQEDREAAVKRRKEMVARVLSAHRNKPKCPKKETRTVPKETVASLAPEPIAKSAPIPQYGAAGISVYREGEQLPSLPSPALVQLVNQYLDVAHNRTRQIAFVWPTAPKTLLTIHALATLERWKSGDKLGVRSAIYPAKSNVFYPLNHLYYDRQQVLALASDLVQLAGQSTAQIQIVRNLPEKDSFLLSLGSIIQSNPGEPFNPTVADLLPTYLASAGFSCWDSCSQALLKHVTTRVKKRSHKKSLRSNCDYIGDPKKAPDAIFALDGRMSKDELRKALRKLAECGPPDVVLVNATRAVRKSGRGWDKHITRFCIAVEEVFPKDKRPGILIITDEPHAALGLREQLHELNDKLKQHERYWNGRDAYGITAACNGTPDDAFMEVGQQGIEMPMPREFDVEVVDAEANAVISKLYRIANGLGRAEAQPVLDAAGFLSRMAALPCGVATLTEWLSLSTTSDHSRRVYSWNTYHAALTVFAQQENCGDEKANILECLKVGTRLFENYQTETPSAERLASLVGHYVIGKKKQVVLVFTNAVYRRLAERFLADYANYPNSTPYGSFAERIEFLSSSQLADRLDQLEARQLIFVGLDDEGLRLVMMDNRIAKHTAILLTTRAGQYLKGTLELLLKHFEAFKTLKPRMESILRHLRNVTVDRSILSLGDYVMPTFRNVQAAEAEEDPESSAGDPEAWRIFLENGHTLYRRATHRVYLYDPTSEFATDRGFRTCHVSELKEGDRLFCMSPDLRELVEATLKEAGVPIAHDESFEKDLREYHADVTSHLAERFPARSRAAQMRQLRAHILADLEGSNPKIAKELPGEAAVAHWINLGAAAATAFEDLQPQAPQRFEYFDAFARALGFKQVEIKYYWREVIMPIRNVRRLDGRQLSERYTYMLLHPESAMLNGGIPRETIKMLFSKARDNVVVIEKVEFPKEKPKNE
jgi:hypothetical protein